eukprot:scaffold90498_cov32-Tisochrysis_lutea.AAC.4
MPAPASRNPTATFDGSCTARAAVATVASQEARLRASRRFRLRWHPPKGCSMRRRACPRAALTQAVIALAILLPVPFRPGLNGTRRGLT